ncbi:hypothetical protein PYCCODRAFT_1432719 [Trametes coccinea BRFM310]|uniref:Uncharacterized protein n=1 Tax=Trametes coccinea (strain BRFM310) TaxID=1353009 RepID=A0A1Y2IV12_TRAC3|nr:hypothetical protein PYCCODRAFT_1432719 [Trametes coccinea BRFM310]
MPSGSHPPRQGRASTVLRRYGTLSTAEPGSMQLLLVNCIIAAASQNPTHPPKQLVDTFVPARRPATQCACAEKCTIRPTSNDADASLPSVAQMSFVHARGSRATRRASEVRCRVDRIFRAVDRISCLFAACPCFPSPDLRRLRTPNPTCFIAGSAPAARLVLSRSASFVSIPFGQPDSYTASSMCKA